MNATAATRTCVYPSCSSERSKKAGRGLCANHYQLVRREGRLSDFPGSEVFESIEHRFFSKVSVTGFCWIWESAKNDRGYGKFGSGGRGANTVYAHRWAYEYLVGPIPEGLTLDHLCRVPLCVNPDRLEPVTLQENIARKPPIETCIRGHDLAKAYVRKNGDRMCQMCRKVLRDERRASTALATYQNGADHDD